MIKSIYEDNLYVGGKPVSVAVLDDEYKTRVFTKNNLHAAFGVKNHGNRTVDCGPIWGTLKLPQFLSSSNIRNLLTNDIIEDIINPIEYEDKSGNTAHGFPATRLYDVCEVFNKLEKIPGGALKTQSNIIEIANTLRVALGRIGVIALIDDATGYSNDKERAQYDLKNELIQVRDEAVRLAKENIDLKELIGDWPYRCKICGCGMPYDKSGLCDVHKTEEYGWNGEE